MHRSEIRLFPPCLGSRVLHAAVLVWVQPEMRYGLTVACGGDGAKEKVLMHAWRLEGVRGAGVGTWESIHLMQRMESAVG
jgi:hypothetical protein